MMLSIKNIKTYYGNIQALKGVSIDIDEGEIITLIGANGAGKNHNAHVYIGYCPAQIRQNQFQ